MWKIGGEGARCSVSRDWNVVPRPQLSADRSLLLTYSLEYPVLSTSFPFPRFFFLFPFSHFLLAIDTCILVPLSCPPLLFTSVILLLSFNEIIRPFATHTQTHILSLFSLFFSFFSTRYFDSTTAKRFGITSRGMYIVGDCV